MAFTFAGQYGPEMMLGVATGNNLVKALPAQAANVYVIGTTTPITLYTSRTKGSTQSQPVTADSNGNLTFFADPGRYDLVYTPPGGVQVRVTVEVNLDTAEFSVNEPYVNPMNFGAKFDNSTNDTVALQAAIDAVHNAGVGKILLPAGMSLFSNLILRPKTTIEGMGTNVTLLSRIVGSTGPAVTDAVSQGATSIDLRSFTIECNNCTGNGLDIGFQSGGPDFNYWGTLRDLVVRDVAAGSIGIHADADTIFASNVGIYSCGQGLVTGLHGANCWNFLHIVNSVAEDLVVNSLFDRFVGLTIERMQARASGGCVTIPASSGYAAFLGLTFDVEAAITVLNMIDIASGGGSFDLWGGGVNVNTGGAITNLVNSEAWGVVTPGYVGFKSAILPEWHYHSGTGEPGPIWFDSSLGVHRELTGTRWSVTETVGAQYSSRGVATLVAGTVVVTNHLVTATSRIHLAAQDNNTTGALRVSARTAGTSFTITSSNAADTGVVAYEINEKASY